jgi:excisionase family DNA binding protein
MNNKRRCKYPGCGAALWSGNKGDYCSLHEAKEYTTEMAPNNQVEDTIPSRERMYTVKDLMKILGYSDKTIRNMLKQGEILGERIKERGRWLVPENELDRFKKEGPGKDPTGRELLSTEEIKEHDIGKFREADSIMGEVQVLDLLWRLQHVQRYSANDFSMLLDFQRFFHLISNYYINKELREARKKLWGGFEKLITFMQVNFETSKRAGWFHDEIRMLDYHPDVHGMDKFTEYEVLVDDLKQVVESAEVIYNKYRDTVKRILGI